jgi:hypothetical protein
MAVADDPHERPIAGARAEGDSMHKSFTRAHRLTLAVTLSALHLGCGLEPDDAEDVEVSWSAVDAVKLRLDAGGQGDALWSSDTQSQPSPFSNHATAGNKVATSTVTVDVSDPSLPSGTPASLFQTERYAPTGDLVWSFPVKPGVRHEVRLYFAEIFSGCQQSGCRTMDVRIEGTTVLAGYDTFAEVGGAKGVMKSFITVPDATLEVQLARVTQNPRVMGIEIIERGCDFTVTPSENVQARLDAAPTGATLCFAPGLYRTGDLTPKTGQRLVGAPGRGSILDGSKKVTGFVKSGIVWVATGQNFNPVVVLASEGKRECESEPADCHYADLFLDGVRQKRVLSMAAVTPGSWHWDYATDKVYLGTDPAGKQVELTGHDSAVSGTAYSIEGFVIRRYGFRAVTGASSVTVRDNEITRNHGTGLKVGGNSKVIGNHIHRNGQYGIAAAGADILVEQNELDYNNDLHFANSGGGYWNAGTTKFVLTDGLVFRTNHSHDNFGDGFWTDIDNVDTTVANNVIENNERFGINHEISYDMAVHDNVLVGNHDAGIRILASPNAEVYGNLLDANGGGVVIHQTDRGDGQYGPHLTANVSVHHNEVHMQTGFTGAIGQSSIFSSGNQFESNEYYLPSLSASLFRWSSGSINAGQWEAFGHDDTGGFHVE